MSNVLKYPISDYVPVISSLTIEQQRREYARLRKIANKRLMALSRSEFAGTNAYKRNIGKFDIPASKLSSADLRWKLQEVSRFLTSKAGSVTGQRKIRKQFLETAREHGLKFVTKENYLDFGKFMGYLRAKMGNKLFDSEEAVDVFESVENINIDAETLANEFNYFLENMDLVQEIPRSNGAKLRNSIEVRKYFNENT